MQLKNQIIYLLSQTDQERNKKSKVKMNLALRKERAMQVLEVIRQLKIVPISV